MESETERPLVNFPPSIWGDFFLDYKCDVEINSEHAKQVEKLKEKVRRLLIDTTTTAFEKMDLIDDVIRLGVGYHFEMEIQQAVEELANTNLASDNEHNLHTVSLHFRLLRQHGYNFPSDVFKKFQDDKGEFKSCLASDVEGILSLYEASNLSVHGEEILDKALEFTKEHLQNLSATMAASPLRRKIQQALVQPYHKGMPRLETRRYIPIYQESEKSNELLLKLAKLDYSLLRSLHLDELREVTEWYKTLNFATKLPYVRDRVVEHYFWMLGAYTEPRHSRCRVLLAKMTTMIVLLDDTYDAYGTMEELKLFTEAMQRWDISAIDGLPDYMKYGYKVIMDCYDKIEKDLIEEGRAYRFPYIQEAVKAGVRAYWIEAKWCKEGYVPTTKEYLDVGAISINYTNVAFGSLLSFGDHVNKEAFEWLAQPPKMYDSLLVMSRVSDDLKSHKFEQQRTHVASVVQCYTKEHGVSDEEACDVLKKMIDSAWKDINEGMLKPHPVPMEVLMRILNFARMVDVIYKDLDGYTFAHLVIREHVQLMLVDPSPM